MAGRRGTSDFRRWLDGLQPDGSLWPAESLPNQLHWNSRKKTGPSQASAARQDLQKAPPQRPRQTRRKTDPFTTRERTYLRSQLCKMEEDLQGVSAGFVLPQPLALASLLQRGLLCLDRSDGQVRCLFTEDGFAALRAFFARQPRILFPTLYRSMGLDTTPDVRTTPNFQGMSKHR